MIWNARNGQAALEGAHMDYVSFGRGDKALIILPGLSDGLATVKGKALLLARPYKRFFAKYTIYMFSRREPLPAGHSIRDMARDQALAAQGLGITNASVLGVSEGGMIAQNLALDYPDLVEKLVIAVSAPRVNPTIRASVGRWIEFAQQGDHKQLMIDTAESSYSEAYLQKYRRIYPLLRFLGRPSSYDRFLVNARAILDFDAYNALPAIACPTLILGGSDDRIVGAEASRELHRLIAGSELHLYDGLGHAAYEEAPDFNERVFAFLTATE